MNVVIGIEADRLRIRAAAQRIIKEMLEKPRPKHGEDTRTGWLAPPPVSAFKNLEPLGFGIPNDDWWIFDPIDCKPDLVWPLDVGVIIERGGVENNLEASRSYTITAKEARGRVSRFSPFMVRQDYATILDGNLVTASGIFSWVGGDWTDANGHARWKTINGKALMDHYTMPDNDRRGPYLSTSLALRQRYEWAVSLGFPESPSIRFATDPTGIKELFKIRDLPEGRDRRSMLMTWISDHWRQDRSDPEMEVYVRKHLRGAVNFSWQGMNGHVLPSQFDIDKRDEMIAVRNNMRSTGVGRRTKPPES